MRMQIMPLRGRLIRLGICGMLSLLVVFNIFTWTKEKHENCGLWNKVFFNRDTEIIYTNNFSSREMFISLDPFSCPDSSQMIKVWKLGRLGNQMSSYATLLLLALRLNRYPTIPNDLKKNLNKYFSGLSVKSDSEVPLLTHCKLSYEEYWLELATNINKLNSSMISTPDKVAEKGIYITGYPDEMTLYGKYSKLLLGEFSFHDAIVAKGMSIMGNYTTATSKMVAVHVRRTDYMGTLKNVHNGSEFIGVKYFTKAMNYFREKYRHEKIRFMVFSDDLKWCKKKIVGKDVLFPGDGDINSPAVDMFLITQCDHAILTYGTFGFWGAFLGPHQKHGEIVVAANFTPIVTALEARVPVIDYMKNWHLFTDT